MKIQDGIRLILCAAAIAGLWACDADPVEMNGGTLPDSEALENTYVSLRSMRSSQRSAYVNLTEGSSMPAIDKLYCYMTQPADKAMSVTASIDEDLVALYNAENGTDYELFPKTNVSFPKTQAISVESGKRISGYIDVKFSSEGLSGGTYLLPVTITAEGVNFSEANRAVYYLVSVYEPYTDDYPLDTDMGLSIVYLNTEDYQPLLVDVIGLSKSFRGVTQWTHSYCNIVNLRTVQIGRDETTGRAMLLLNADIRWVLDHADKYIRPLQDKGRKVCLSLEGGGTGLGFCNLTDAQIDDFVAQIKAVVDNYPIDGINLWDRNSGYSNEDAPAMNKTSYPKLIVALRKMLGEDRLLTLTDYKEPTEYFWDTSADGTNGIKVGDYLDYAWSGYMSNEEGIQVVDPWKQGNEGVSTLYPRQPIAGLTADKYGCVGFPFRAISSDDDFETAMMEMMNLQMWAMNGMPNQIIVFNDMITNIQGAYEGVIWDTFATFAWQNMFPYDGSQYSHAILHPEEMNRKYNGFAKDW